MAVLLNIHTISVNCTLEKNKFQMTLNKLCDEQNDEKNAEMKMNKNDKHMAFCVGIAQT